MTNDNYDNEQQHFLCFEYTNDRITCRDGTPMIVVTDNDDDLDHMVAVQSSRVGTTLTPIEVGSYMRRFNSKDRNVLLRSFLTWVSRKLDLGEEVDLDALTEEYVGKAFN